MTLIPPRFMYLPMLAMMAGFTVQAALAGAFVSACADEAANPFQPGYEGRGKGQGAIDFDAAFEACRAAAESDPDNMDVQAWLARLHYLQNDFEAMFPGIERSAEAGNAMAQQILGDVLVVGKGVDIDLQKSAEWLKASAASGYPLGQYSLAMSYLFGDGVEADAAAAAALYAAAAQQGYAQAKRELGVLYLEGRGVPEDSAMARTLFEAAAEEGERLAMLDLGDLYLHGMGVEADFETAIAWGERAEAAGETSASQWLALAYLGEEGNPVDLDLAEEWARRAIEAGDNYGHVVLGYIDEEGLAGEPDLDAARAHFEAGAALGEEEAIEALARLKEE